MIIKSCYIENFGTFHQKNFDFTDGINIIKEDNGWGKSTLAVFIKSMFYGMEYSRRKKLTEYKKYEPWQGGKYGGYLVFSVGDKTYRVTRYFGKKEADNVFELYDMQTNMQSNDYSKSLGDEIFGIDCQSFERSIFIKLDSEANSPEMSDSISAKLNNLVDNTDDINNFETARARLDKLAVSVTPKRGSGGMIGEADERIRKIQEELFACDNAEREINVLKGAISRAEEEKVSLGKRQSELTDELNKFSLIDKKERYEKLLENEKHFNEKREKLSEFFANGMPTDAEIDLHLKEAQEADISASKLSDITGIDEKRRQLADTEIFFAGNIPSDEDINECQNNIIEFGRVKELLASQKPSQEERARYEAISEKYGGVLPSSEKINACAADFDNSVQITSEINDNNVRLSSLYAKSGTKKAEPNIILVVLFIVLTLSFAVSAALVDYIPVRIAFIAGAVLFAVLTGVQFIGKKADMSEEIDALERETDELKNERDLLRSRCTEGIRSMDANADLSNISHTLRIMWDEMTDAQSISAKISRYESEKDSGKLTGCETKINSFLGQYSYDGTDEDYTKRLSQIQNRLNAYTYLKREITSYDSIKNNLDTSKERLMPFLDRYRAEGESYYERVRYIRDALNIYSDTAEKLKSASEEIVEFTSKNDIEKLKNITPPSALREDIEAEINSVKSRLDDCVTVIARAQRDIERQSVIADRRQELESEREGLNERKAYLIEKHSILTDTIDLLERAKDSLTSKYMDDMTPAFNKYVHMIEPSQDSILLTADLGTQILSGGQQWESGYHSRGYADLVNVCTRLALAEVMYKDEKPFIVLDDPFVNLDDTKTEKALEFLKRLGEGKQIFYFTCHKSRSI